MSRNFADLIETHLSARRGQHLESFSTWSVDDEAAGLVKIAKETDAALARVRSSRDLTAEGKRNKALEIARKAHADVSAWTSRPSVKRIEDRIAMEVDNLNSAVSPTVPTDPALQLLQEIRHAEIRRQLDGLDDPLALEVVYLNGNDEVRAALRNAPPRIVKRQDGLTVQPMVSPERVAEHAAALGAQRDPERATLVSDLEYVAATNRALSGSIMQELYSIAGGEHVLEDRAVIVTSGDGS